MKFSQTDDPLAISDLAYSTATYDMGLHAKFRGRTSCRLKVIGGRNSQLLYRFPSHTSKTPEIILHKVIERRTSCPYKPM